MSPKGHISSAGMNGPAATAPETAEHLLEGSPHRVALRPRRWLLGRWQRTPLARTRLIPVLKTTSEGAFKAFVDESLHGIAPFYAHVDITFARLDVREIQSLSRAAGRARYRKAKRIVRSMHRRGVDLFEPCLLRYRDESAYRLVLPPVVEPTDDGYVVLDGVHRIKAALDEGSLPRFIFVLVVEGHGEQLPPLPATPARWREVHVLPTRRSRSKKFKNLRRKYFRPVGSFLRSEHFWFDSVDSFDSACRQAERRAHRDASARLEAAEDGGTVGDTNARRTPTARAVGA